MRAQTQFVGRDEELALLARRWERARAGEGQLVLIVGDRDWANRGWSRSSTRGSRKRRTLGSNGTPRSFCRTRRSTPSRNGGGCASARMPPAEQRLADLEDTLRLIGLDPAEYAPLLAPLVDIPLPLSRVASFPPEELRRRQLAAMTAWVLAGARSQPIVLAFEDLHWADPTSLDLLRALRRSRRASAAARVGDDSS